jgi:two-component system sensor histidine kinase CiaH
MFGKIRKRLTLLYTALTILFLIGFMVASYWGFKLILYHEEEQDLSFFAHEEAEEHVALLKNPRLPKRDNELVPGDNDKMLFYVYDQNGKLLRTNDPDEELRPTVLSIIRNWKLPHGRAEQHKITTSNGTSFFMMTSQGISDAGRLLGVVYVGRDVTDFYNMLNMYLLIISLIGLGFLLLIYMAGNIIARKAMIPIYKSFERQRQFTADASHELRTPLTVLLSSTEAVLTDRESSISPFASQILLDMKDEIKKINKTVADLLTLARVDAEVQKIFREEFDVVPVIQGAVHSLSSLATKKNIDIELETPDKLIVCADKERLYQLIYILTDNAIKYTMENGRISLSAYMSEDRIFGLSVKDTGIGIAPEDQNRIFERFYRVDKARSREQGGTGLGLSIAKWIVDAHGGSITVKSNLGQGTIFYVTINAANTR